MSQSVDDRLTNSLFRQFRALLAFDVFDDVFHVDLGENPSHHFINPPGCRLPDEGVFGGRMSVVRVIYAAIVGTS